MVQSEPHENELIRPGQNAREVGFFFELAEILCTATVCVALLFTFAARIAGVDGESMLPTLEDGQRLALSAGLREPERGDIVIISPNTDLHEPIVKRVIAVGGDEVDLIDGRVLVNGEEIDEPYLAEGCRTEPKSGIAYPARVPAGYVFVLGDNRGHSADSRSSLVGFVRVEDILGTVLFRTRPLFRTDPFRFTYKVK